MGCDCNCTDVVIDCNCPPTSPIDGASLNTIVSTTFDGVPANIYNGGNGYTHTVYTNTSTKVQLVKVLTNMYITSNNPHDLRTYYNLSIAPLTEANAVTSPSYHNLAPIKTTFTDMFVTVSNLLNPGDSIYITAKSADSTARMVWLTSFIYKYDF